MTAARKQRSRLLGGSKAPDKIPASESAASLDYDPLEAAITVLGNVKIENPSSRMDTEDAHNRVNLALEYLRLEKERRA